MMRSLTQLVSGGVDLIEAEARLARLHIVRIGVLAAVLIACAILAAAAIGVICSGVIIMLAERVGMGQALIWVGAGLSVVVTVIATAAWAGLGRES